MIDSKISNRYAKALLLVGQERGEAHAYVQELRNIASLTEKFPPLAKSLESPLYAMRERRRVLEEIMNRLTLSDPVRTFLLLVFDSGRIRFLKYIVDAYRKYLDETEHIVRAHITTAVDLTDSVADKLRTSLEQKTQKKIQMITNVDKKLIGGVVVQIGHTIIDGSLRMKLKNMKEMLVQETQ